jgi:hypothetical protein
MSAPLLPDVSQKADNVPSRAELEYRERAARLKALYTELDNVNRGTSVVATTRSSNGIAQMLITPDEAPAPALVKKADIASLHPKAQRVASSVSADAATLYSLAAKADDHYNHARLIELNGNEISRALGVSYPDAVAARAELERKELIRFYDDGSGNRGFRVR